MKWICLHHPPSHVYLIPSSDTRQPSQSRLSYPVPSLSTCVVPCDVFVPLSLLVTLTQRSILDYVTSISASWCQIYSSIRVTLGLLLPLDDSGDEMLYGFSDMIMWVFFRHCIVSYSLHRC